MCDVYKLFKFKSVFSLYVSCRLFFHRDVIVTAGFWDGFDDDVEDLLTPQTETPKNLGDANR